MLTDPNSNGTHIQLRPSALLKIFPKVLKTMRESLLWGSMPFQSIEQKLVQRYETHMEAQPYKGSYVIIKKKKMDKKL